jgi:putative kinase
MTEIHSLVVNGFSVTASFDNDNVMSIFYPILYKWTEIQKELNRRIFVYIAAPPGCGKSTLSVFLEKLSQDKEGITEIQAISLDGFHYSQNYLSSHYSIIHGNPVLMSDTKGSPETYDVQKLITTLRLSQDQDLLWPTYNRTKHDIEDNNILINKKIVLVEGNYLLLNEDPWNQISDFCDYSIFIYADIETLKTRLISRKIRGGLSENEALSFFNNTDGPNVERVLKNHSQANTTLRIENNIFYKE